jgi:hypothetical protein
VPWINSRVHFLAETAFLTNEVEQLTAWTVLQHEEQLLVVVEGAGHFNDEWVVAFCLSQLLTYQNLLLREYMLLLVALQDLRFLDHLQGIDAVVVALAYQHNLRVVSLANDSEGLEVLQ